MSCSPSSGRSASVWVSSPASSGAEGRSAFLAAAKPHVQKISALSLRLQIVKEAARLGEVTQEEAELILGLAAKQAYRAPAPARRPSAPLLSPEWKLLSYVAARPFLAAEIDPAVLDMNLPESKALKALCDAFATDALGPQHSAAMLVERFQGSPYAEILFRAQANTMDVAESEEDARVQLRHVLWKIEINRKNGLIRSLTERLGRGQLSKDEHLEYGKMIAEVKALEQRLQAEGRTTAP